MDAVVAFDLDGTLVDSAPDLARALSVVLVEAGLRPVDAAQIQRTLGEGAASLLRRNWEAQGCPPPPDLEGAVSRFLQVYLEGLPGRTTVFPGVRQVLRDLDGYPLALVTNKARRPTERLLASLDLAEPFRAVVAGDDLLRRKPHPDPLWEAARRCGLGPQRGVLIGDSETDAAAAVAAGWSFILVDWGYARGDREQIAAQSRVSSSSELPAAIAVVLGGASPGSR